MSNIPDYFSGRENARGKLIAISVNIAQKKVENRNILKRMVYMIKKNEETISWWEKFKFSLKTQDSINLAEKLDEFDGKETNEDLLAMKRELNNLHLSGEQERAFSRKLRIYENRLTRGINDSFGSTLKHLREKAGYSLKDLQLVTGISASYINRIEKGNRRAPSISIIEKLAIALNVNRFVLINIANMGGETSEKTFDVEELLFANNFTIGGREITLEEKELLIKVVAKIVGVAWTSDTKHLDSVEVVNLINQYRNFA